MLTSLSTLGGLETSGAVSPPLASPTMFRSAAGSPVPDEQIATPARPRAETFGGAQVPIPPYDDSPADAKDKRKWGRLLKKVSTGRLRSASSASKRAAATSNRTVSQPVTRDEESDAEQGTMSRIGMFGGGNSSSSSRSRTKSRPRTNKRQSFLALKASGGADLLGAMTASQPAALEAVLSYLRDLDDLSPDLSLPTIPLDASSPALRHSPSLGALSPGGSYARSPSPGALRRAQSSRRVPSTGSSAHRGSHASSFEDASLPTGDVSAAEEPVLPRADDPVKRAAVIDEIISTEKSYLRGLQELCSIYVASAAVATAPSASSTTGKRDTVVPAIERRAVFGNVVRSRAATDPGRRLTHRHSRLQEAIRDFHAKILLPDLLAADESSTDSRIVADEIGKVFSSHVSFMKWVFVVRFLALCRKS